MTADIDGNVATEGEVLSDEALQRRDLIIRNLQVCLISGVRILGCMENVWFDTIAQITKMLNRGMLADGCFLVTKSSKLIYPAS